MNPLVTHTISWKTNSPLPVLPFKEGCCIQVEIIGIVGVSATIITYCKFNDGTKLYFDNYDRKPIYPFYITMANHRESTLNFDVIQNNKIIDATIICNISTTINNFNGILPSK